MSITRGESKVEHHPPQHHTREVPHGVHHAAQHAYSKDAPASPPTKPDTSQGAVPDASFHKDHDGKQYMNFAPPAEKTPPSEKTRGVKAPEAPAAAATPGDNKSQEKDPGFKGRDSYIPPKDQAEYNKRNLDNKISNFDSSLDTRYTKGRAPIDGEKVDDIAKASKGMDPNQVSDQMQKGMPNFKVSKPNENGDIYVDRKPVIDRGQDTRAFVVNPEKGAGMVINTYTQDYPPKNK